MKRSITGFTIIEVLVVIAVIGILSTVGLLSFSKYQMGTRDSERSAKTVILAEALEKYYDLNGEYPSCSMMTGSASSLTTTILPDVELSTLLTPKHVSGATSSVSCANLTGSSSEPDIFSYNGDGSAACATGTTCLQWTLKYKEENTGNIIAISSRHRVDISVSGAPVLTATPAGYSQVNLMWTTVTGAANYTVQYATNSGFSTGLTTQSVTSTSLSIPGLTSGVTYYFRVQAINGTSVSGWSNIRNIAINFTTLTWKQNTGSGTHYWYSATISDDGTKMAAANSPGYIYTSTDAGVTWTERTSSGIRPWYDIASSADGTRLVALATTDVLVSPNVPGAVFTSNDSGATWIQRTSLSDNLYRSAKISSDGTKLAAGGGAIAISTDSGATWTDRSPNASGGWDEISLSPNGAVLSAKQGNNIYISTNLGVTWATRSAFTSSFAISADGNKLVTGDYGGYIYTSTNAGVNWTQRTAAGSRDWRRFTSSSDGTKLVAFDNSPGYIYTSIDSGATWVAQTVNGTAYRQGIDSSPDGSKIIVGPSYGNVYTGVYTP